MSSADAAAKTVDAYIAAAPEYARPILTKLRTLVRKAAPGLSEAIKWGGPCYVGKGLVCGFAAFKQHVSFHFFKGGELPDPDVVLTHGEGNAAGKSLKLSSVGDIPVKALERLLRAAVAHDASVKANPAPRARRAELPVPDELAAALRKAAKAQASFDALSPSCRREYIEWIVTGKKEETRARRIGETLKMLSEGRRRNEQYR